MLLLYKKSTLFVNNYRLLCAFTFEIFYVRTLLYQQTPNHSNNWFSFYCLHCHKSEDVNSTLSSLFPSLFLKIWPYLSSTVTFLQVLQGSNKIFQISGHFAENNGIIHHSCNLSIIAGLFAVRGRCVFLNITTYFIIFKV